MHSQLCEQQACRRVAAAGGGRHPRTLTTLPLPKTAFSIVFWSGAATLLTAACSCRPLLLGRPLGCASRLASPKKGRCRNRHGARAAAALH